MIDNEQMEKIKLFAIDLDWNHAFGGKSKGNEHLSRVVEITKRITDELSLEDNPNYNLDESVVEAGAWLHDSGLAKELMGDALCNQEKVEQFLRSIGVDEIYISKILTCISSHDGQNIAISIEAQVVHDADTLDKMGPLGVIRETWKKSQFGWTSEEIAKHLPVHLEKRKNNLYTNIAQLMAEELHSDLKIFFESLKKQNI